MLDEPTWPALITTLLEGRDLTIAESTWAMEQVMSGAATPAQLAGFLIALRGKGETVDEIVGFRDAVLEHALVPPIGSQVLDIVGTGGDRLNTVNISTAASIISAAAGARVVKHGNRAVSSASGASDVLGALGIDVAIDPARVAAVFDEVGITFVWAAVVHPGFKHAAVARGDLGVPTVFNFLGPLCNPVRPEASAVGVARAEVVPLITGVFEKRGASALVFRGDDGLDELSTTGYSHVWQVASGVVTEYNLDPRELGIPRAGLADLVGGTPTENAATLRRALSGETGPVRDIFLLNAAAGLTAWELSLDPALIETPLLDRLAVGLERATTAVDSGAALRTLDAWVEASAR
ncbi:MAG: anthranilate phosphoribosyltransferase [Naasia sp.]